MPTSHTPSNVNLAQTLLFTAGNEALTSSFLAQVQSFNDVSRRAFYMMLDAHKDDSRERMTAFDKDRAIRWLTESVPERRVSSGAGKKRSWVKSGFIYDYEEGKLMKLPEVVFKKKREVISEDQIFDTIIGVHTSLGHVGQKATATAINKQYYGIKQYYDIATQKVHFLIKLCETCHRKAHSKSRGPMESIVTTRLFERVQIDLIDMTSTPDGEYVWICHMEDYFSKFHRLFPMANKETPTVAPHIHTWISILDIFEILQSDNGSEFKGICLELTRRYGIKVINGRPRTPRTQGLLEQANGTVKTRILCWKRDNGSTRWSVALEEIMLQLNRTYHGATKSMPYEVVFNRRPNYKRALPALRLITEDEVVD